MISAFLLIDETDATVAFTVMELLVHVGRN